MRSLSCLLALLLLYLSVALSFGDFEGCGSNRGEYCSVGKVGHFYGSLVSSEGFLRALKTVGYKNELILVTTYGSFHLEFFFQLYHRLMTLGLAHFLGLSMVEDGCRKVRDLGADKLKISCGWDNSTMHTRSWGGGPLLWHLRWRFLARAARVGYNILSLDSDFAVFQDPYPYLKGPGCKDIQLLVMEEGPAMNGGFAYMQNTRPDGPIAWLFHHTTEVPLRWMDDDMEFTTSLGNMHAHNTMCCSFDQCFLADSVESVHVGAMITRCAFHTCKGENYTLTDGKDVFTKGFSQEYQWETVQNHTKKEFVVIRPEHWPEVANDWKDKSKVPHGWATQLRMTTVKVPNWGTPDGNPPPIYGGPLYTRKGGKYTDEYFKQLKGDCPNCPWWKELDPKDQKVAHNITEKFGYIPGFIVDSASYSHYGYVYSPDGVVRQVLLHYHIMRPKGFPSKLYGVWDWELSNWLHSTPDSEKTLELGPYLRGAAPEKLIMYDTSKVDLTRTRSWEEFQFIVTALVALAHVTKRTVVYPDVPCETVWAFKEREKGVPACTTDLKFERSVNHLYPYPVLEDPYDPNNKKKIWSWSSSALAASSPYHAVPPCTDPRRLASGIIYAEFQHWLKEDRPEIPKRASSSNTVMFEGLSGRPSKLVKEGGEKTLLDELLLSDFDSISKAVQPYEDEMILYVGRPVGIPTFKHAELNTSWEERQLHNMVRDCDGLAHLD